MIVIKDIFRKYPNKYESIIRDLCENLKVLDNADARAAMIWIIGEYGDRIDNSIDLMFNFSENFKEQMFIWSIFLIYFATFWANFSVNVYIAVDNTIFVECMTTLCNKMITV